MEGQLLSGEAPGGEDAAVLRRALRDGRDQLHVLSHAEREDPRRLEPRDAGEAQADPQGPQAHHPHREAAPLREPPSILSTDRSDARTKARRDPLPAAAVIPKRSPGTPRL